MNNIKIISNGLKILRISAKATPILRKSGFSQNRSLTTFQPFLQKSPAVAAASINQQQLPTQQNLEALEGQEGEKQKNYNPDKLYKSIELEVLAYEPGTIKSYEWFVKTAASHLDITITKREVPHGPHPGFNTVRFPMLKCVHIYKKAQVHYEVRSYHLYLTLHRITGSTADTFLEYIQRNLPEGMGMKVMKVEVQPLPDYIQKPKEEDQIEKNI